MFRKYYKEANDSIKPNEAFMLSVIENAKKRKPPAYARYTKYAAAIAAAVVVVSGTVLSMPLWQKVTDDTDGIIIEETVTDNTAATAVPANAANAPVTSPQNKTAVSPKGAVPDKFSGQSSSQNTSEHSYHAFGDSLVHTEQMEVETVTEQTESRTEAEEETQTTADGKGPENSLTNESAVMKSVVAGETEQETNIASMPEDMAAYGEAVDASEAATAKMAAIDDTDIPTPAGYYCTNAAPNGYTFVNDDGAVIIVTINYGGEEHEPYIEENGDNIYAVFTSFGLSVTINASGADRAAVEEIINSLR